MVGEEELQDSLDAVTYCSLKRQLVDSIIVKAWTKRCGLGFVNDWTETMLEI